MIKKIITKITIIGLVFFSLIGLFLPRAEATSSPTAVDTLPAAIPLNNTPIQLVFWHSMAGEFGQIINELVSQFNRQHPNIHVTAVYKGNYPETLTSTVAAFRAGEHPDLVQIFEVGTATMIHPRGVIIPVSQLMAENKVPLNEKDFIPAIRAYYGDQAGHLLALPFNSSSAVLFYNKDAFRRAGLNPDRPPKTWLEMKDYSVRLLKSGMSCGFTTAWPSWINLETFSAWHNISFATANNGFDGLMARVQFNNPAVAEHIAALASWQDQHIFRYGGRGDDAEALFDSGKCGMILQSSGWLLNLKSTMKFGVGVGAIPYWPQFPRAPQNTLIGGAALWIMAKKPVEHYPAIAQFLAFLTNSQQLAYFEERTGYLPITFSAYHIAQQHGFYKRYPEALVAFNSVSAKLPTQYSQGIRLGNFAHIRMLNDEALEAIWSGTKMTPQALTQAVERDNALLKQFELAITGTIT